MRKYIYSIIIIIPFIIGCSSPKEIIREIPVEIIKEVEKKVVVHDSTFVHDSTTVYQKGDTVFKDKTKYIYVQKEVHDTLATHDTITNTVYVPEEKIVTVKEPQWWPVWIFVGVILIAIIIYLYIKNKIKIIKPFN